MVKGGNRAAKEIIVFKFKPKKRWHDTLYWRTIRRLARYSETLHRMYQKRIQRDAFYTFDDHW